MAGLETERIRSRSPAASRPLRIAFLHPPGDVISSYRQWREGREPAWGPRSASGQFYSVCERLGARVLLVALIGLRTPAETELSEGQFHIVCRRCRANELSGLRYHWSLLGYGLRAIASVVRFRADIVVVSEGVHRPLLFPLAAAGYKIVPSLACALWPETKPPPLRKRLMQRLSSLLYRRFAFAIISMSDQISAQLRSISGGRTRPIVEWLPTYLRPASVAPDPSGGGPFRVLFAGRIEHEKGVFDVLAIARRFREAGGPDMTFELCGRGRALDELKAAAAAAGLAPERFLVRGHCPPAELSEAYARCHAVIVPTTSSFAEGLNQVVIEAILATRPVVTSRICPAIRYVQGGVVEVPPDDVQAYGNALLRLATDRDFYEAKRSGCRAIDEPFYDPRNGLAAAFQSIFEAARDGREPVARTVPVECSHDSGGLTGQSV
jgi:glycosyltransferase involved in cell wall biosynthesis